MWAYVATAAAVFAVGVPVYLMPFFSPEFHTSLFMRWLWVLACLVLLVSCFVPWFRLSDVGTGRKESLEGLARMLRTMGYSVDNKPDCLDVRLDKLTHMKIRANKGVSGTKLDFQVGTTPLSATVIIVVFLVFPPVSVILSLVAFRAASGFVEKKLVPRLGGLPAVASAPKDVRSTLIDSLSEGHRLAREAYESAKSNYEDLVLVLIICGIAFSFGTFLATMWIMQSDAQSERLLYSAIVGALAMLGFTVPSILNVRARRMKTISRFKEQTKRLGDALALELSSAKPPDGYPSSFEVIVGAGEQVPVWLATRKRAGMHRHPSTWTAIFLFAYLGVFMCFFGVSGLLSDLFEPVIAVIVTVAGCVMISSTVLVYSRWREDERLESDRLTREWDGRLQMLKSEMEEYLQGM